MRHERAEVALGLECPLPLCSRPCGRWRQFACGELLVGGLGPRLPENFWQGDLLFVVGLRSLVAAWWQCGGYMC